MVFSIINGCGWQNMGDFWDFFRLVNGKVVVEVSTINNNGVLIIEYTCR